MRSPSTPTIGSLCRPSWAAEEPCRFCGWECQYWFVGRKKEIIIRGGSNISPVEVEGVLYEHPAVKEAGVVGVPNPTWGEVVHAYVAPKDGTAPSEAELKQFVQERLAAYKVPEAIHFLSELPKGSTGKIHRKTLRDWAGASPPE